MLGIHTSQHESVLFLFLSLKTPSYLSPYNQNTLNLVTSFSPDNVKTKKILHSLSDGHSKLMRKAFSAESSLFIKATHTRSSLAIPFHYISTVCIWNEINKKFWHDIDSDDDVDGEVEQQLLSWVEVE